MEEQQEKSSWAPSIDSAKGIISTLLIVALGGFVVGELATWITDSALAGTRLAGQLAEAKEILTLWDILALPAIILTVLGSHEIGHVVGGLSQGMRFLMLIVGPFGWHAASSGVRFEWNTNVALMGGLAAALPTTIGSSLRRQLLVLTAGGPVASLLLAIIAFALSTISEPRFAAYLIIMASFSMGIFIVTLIPTRAGGFMSDGMQMIDILRGGNAVIERGALMQIFAQSLQGVRPRDWDLSAIETLSRIGSEDPTRTTGGNLYLIARAMDCHDVLEIARNRTVLEENINEYPSGFRQAVRIELAICAWLAGETEAVRRHLEESKGGIVEKSRRHLAEAALAKLEGRDADCEKECQLARKELDATYDAGQAKLTEDQIAMLNVRAT